MGGKGDPSGKGFPLPEENASVEVEVSRSPWNLRELLHDAIGIARGLGDPLLGDVPPLEDLKSRLDQGRLHLAVLGQFKRGKSTLLNALLGEDVLPTDVVPLTAVPTFIRPAPSRRVPRLFFILNKVDYLAPGELRAAAGFLQDVLAEQVGVGREEPLFCVSARYGLEARRREDEGLWKRSGLEEVKERLVRFLAEEKTLALRRAIRRERLTAELFRKRLADTLAPYRERADGLIETIRRTASELFDVPYRALESEGV